MLMTTVTNRGRLFQSGVCLIRIDGLKFREDNILKIEHIASVSVPIHKSGMKSEKVLAVRNRDVTSRSQC